MKPSQPSRTAFTVARRRAVHQVIDRPVVFEDPLALTIMGAPPDALPDSYDPKQEESLVSRRLRAFVCVRSRVAEDMLAEAVTRGARQYVILGAGFDTFAYRNPFVNPPVRAFEVDYPATQAWKRERLAETGISIPDSLTFAPVDFDHQTIESGLRDAGWNPEAGTFFSWLGVTPYLTRETIAGNLSFVGSLARAGTGIVFDYGIAPESLGLLERMAYRAFAERVAAAGEPWRSSYAPDDLVAEMRSHGFREVNDLTPEQINQRYFSGRQDDLKVGSLGHIMTAWV